MPNEKKAAAIQVILTKLSGKARNLFNTTPLEVDEIVTTLNSNCCEYGNSDLALANLKNLKKKPAEETQSFTKQVDILAEKLSAAYIRKQIPSEVARKMAPEGSHSKIN